MVDLYQMPFASGLWNWPTKGYGLVISLDSSAYLMAVSVKYLEGKSYIHNIYLFAMLLYFTSRQKLFQL